MARPLRIEFAGAIYHLTARGNARSDIYVDDEDRGLFLDILGQVVERFGWVCHAYCLMSNHYHLMVETPDANLSRGMRHLNGVYTQRFNRRHAWVGHVFQGRYKAIVVEKDAYLLALSRYIVRNPVAAGMVADVGDWSWSSYRATAGEVVGPAWLHKRWLLSQFGQGEAKAAYADYVRDGVEAAIWDERTGADVLGDDNFRKALTDQVAASSAEVPKRKRVLRHLPLQAIACDKALKDWVHEAYSQHGYTMSAIAAHAGVHHSTVSRLIKKAEQGEGNN